MQSCKQKDGAKQVVVIGLDVSSYLPLPAADDDIHRSPPATPPAAIVAGAALVLKRPPKINGENMQKVRKVGPEQIDIFCPHGHGETK